MQTVHQLQASAPGIGGHWTDFMANSLQGAGNHSKWKVPEAMLDSDGRNKYLEKRNM